MVDIGAFQSSLVVESNAGSVVTDASTMTLPGAVALADQFARSSITFDPTAFATQETITLTGNQLELSNTALRTTIAGPASGVTISGGGISRVFQVDNSVTAVLSGLTITGGSTDGSGGAVYNDGTLTLGRCTISGNTAAGGGGGGMFDLGTATLSNCTISGNSAVTGGGIELSGAGATLNLTNCTIAGNNGIDGGGVTNALGTLNLADCTISGNDAQFGGGVDSIGTNSLIGTIVAGNTHGSAANDLEGSFTGSYNLIGIGGSGRTDEDESVDPADHNLVNIADPLLAPLRNHGGLTETMPLLPGSPAIGAGTAISGISNDQRGVARPASNPDIGAFQDQGFSITIIGSSSESAPVGQPFAQSLEVQVISLAGDPVAGGAVTFTPPTSGASANLGSPPEAGTQTVTIGPRGGLTTIAATANDIAGSYAVTATASGIAAPVQFDLTNTDQPTVFSNLVGPTITYGTPSVSLRNHPRGLDPAHRRRRHHHGRRRRPNRPRSTPAATSRPPSVPQAWEWPIRLIPSHTPIRPTATLPGSPTPAKR